MTKSRKERTRAPTETTQSTMGLKPIQPKTDNQAKAFNSFKNKNLLMHGLPGTGKTFIALYLALKALTNKEINQIIIVRSAVTTRDIGHMPGNAAEKMKNFESPYYSLVNKLYGRGDAYDILKQKKQIVFMPTTFIRGVEFNDSIVIVDEAQNMSDHELHSVITRLGDNSKMIICGDVRQDDLSSERYKEFSGLAKIMKILRTMNSINTVEFTEDDIVRGGFMKDYIIARDKFERSERTSSKKIEGPDITKLPSFITNGTGHKQEVQPSTIELY